jgi:pterin-4a-carbinolamine dehydratase
MNAKQKDRSLVPADSKLRRPPRPTFLKSERVQEELATMPGWWMLPGEESIGRVRDFPEPGAAAAYASFVAELVGRDGHPFLLERVDRRIRLTLFGVAKRKDRETGITPALINTARALG